MDATVATFSLNKQEPYSTGLDFATKVADYVNNDIKKYGEEGLKAQFPYLPEEAAPDEVVDGVKGTSGLLVAILSGSPSTAIGGLKDWAKVANKDDPVGKKLVEVAGSAAGCLLALSPSSGIADKIACATDQAELLTKGLVDAYAALQLSGANEALYRINAVSEYLDAYYRAGGDTAYIARVLKTDKVYIGDILWDLYCKASINCDLMRPDIREFVKKVLLN